MAPTAADETYQTEILSGVSRTFALTIPQLPSPLRRTVSNAYLLCRIADTIEDDNSLTLEQKNTHAERFINAVDQSYPAEDFASALTPLLAGTALEAERDLVANAAKVLRITHDCSENQQRAMAKCVRTMARGMVNYQSPGSPAGVADMAAMDRYCYFVAGVVGEMLTELFCDYSTEINVLRPQLMRLAVSFGQGLQMTNILKDIWEDRSRGVCWLPREVFSRHGFDLRTLAADNNPPAFTTGLGELLGVAHAHLRNALTYTLLLPRHERGMRRFCLWALGMAVLTLRKINNHRRFTAGEQVKISRRSVTATVTLTSQVAGNDTLLRLLFGFAASRLPVNSIHETLTT